MTRTACKTLAHLALLSVPALIGCNSRSLSMTAHEREHMHEQVRTRDSEALREDIDMILLNDRPTRLTRWHDR